MTMWFSVYQSSDGALKGQGSQIPSAAELAARGLVAKPFPARPVGKLWNPATLDFDIDEPIILPKLEAENFMLRFTLAEHAKLLEMAATDFRAAAWVDRVKFARGVSQETPEIRQGLTYLVGKGILTTARAKKIGVWA